MRLSYCGVCHSDVHIRAGFFDMGGGVKAKMADRGVALPLTLGHEPIGTVAAVGSDVADVHVGQTYLVNPWIGCGKCDVCLNGRDNLCEKSSSMGVARPGGFSTHLVVPHARYLVDVQGLDLAQAAVLACSGVTAYSAATKLAPAQPGHSVAALGCGGLGLMSIAVLRALGSVTGKSAQMRALVALVRSGKLKLPPVQVRPLDQAEQSLKDLEAGRVSGRIVLNALAVTGSTPPDNRL